LVRIAPFAEKRADILRARRMLLLLCFVLIGFLIWLLQSEDEEFERRIPHGS
jgi:hypothetical protein